MATKKSPASKRPSSKPAADEASLLFHAMYLMAVIDGETSRAELSVVEALLTNLPDFGKTTVDALVTTSKKLVASFGGTIESLEAVVAIKGKSARTKCFLLAAEVAYASGGIGKAEAALLTTLATLLKLDKETTRSIVKVLGLKYG